MRLFGLIITAMLLGSCEATKVSSRSVKGSGDSATTTSPTSTTTSISSTHKATAAAPTFSPAAGTYTSSQSVTLSSLTAGATIYYTTDGTTPTVSSTPYSAPVTVSATQTLKAFAVKESLIDSSAASAAYIIDTTSPVVTFTSIAPVSPHWNRTPTLTVNMSETATLTLYSNIGCTVAASPATVLDSGAATITTNNLVALAKTTLYGKAVDAAGNASACTSLTTFTNLIRLEDPNPSAGNGFGTHITELSNGNIAVTSPQADIGGVTDAGAVYLYSISTGALISSLYGTSTSDNVGNGGITTLSNGNFVVRSGNWDCTVAAGCSGANVGAVTWGSGTAGVSGAVGATNSLIGSTMFDSDSLTVTALSNGNYVVANPYWDCSVPAGCSGAIADVGAVTWGLGATGISGAISTANSFVGATANDRVGGSPGVTALTNGNFVVPSFRWDCSVAAGCSGALVDAGAVTWGSGTAGLIGTVSSSNSLIGSSALDGVGETGIFALTNGHFVVASQSWNCTVAAGCSGAIARVGAVTWGSGTTSIIGTISSTNSLIGGSLDDKVGEFGAASLANGNYVVLSPSWDCSVAAGCVGTNADVGAVTWGSGTTGISGAVTSSNSLIGSSISDRAGYDSVVVLTNGNYVVRSSQFWNCTVAAGCPSAVNDVGAITWGSGTTGISGPITTSNSLVGSSLADRIGGVTGSVTPLSNGNYVVASPYWDCLVAVGCSSDLTNVGAVTWGSGTTGISGVVSHANSLHGSFNSDNVGTAITPLSNGNYVVNSFLWNCTIATGCAGTVLDVGAVTWGSGTAATAGVVSTSNSLVGSTANDTVGSAFALSGGNYVVTSPSWDCSVAAGCASAVADVGAYTWASGTTGIIGTVSTSNSMIGASNSAGALSNGNFVLSSSLWDCSATTGCSGAITNVGAVTWGSGTAGLTGDISRSNSLTGSATGDQFGSSGLLGFSSGNYLVKSPYWNASEGLWLIIPGAFSVSGSF